MEQVEKSCDRICLIHRGRAVVQGDLTRIRQEHGSNTVHVEYTGVLPRAEIADLTDGIDDHGHYAEIRLRRAEDAGTLLRRLVDHVEIRRFELSEASLHDIFIRLVEAA